MHPKFLCKKKKVIAAVYSKQAFLTAVTGEEMLPLVQNKENNWMSV